MTSSSDHPSVSFLLDGASQSIDCDVIAGCDGFHGVSRDSIPAGVLTTYEREYPFAWLGILASVAPSSDELIYCYQRTRIRAAQHAISQHQPPVPAGSRG